MLRIDRRAFVQTGMLGLGALALPGGRLAAQTLLGLTGFTHDVASGEPGPDSVLLWTRYKSASGGPARVRVELASDSAFARVVGGAEMTTGPWRDHTVKLTVDSLRPATRYYYRFIAPDGSFSPVGRTKTLPVGRTSRFALAVFSCSNIGYGEFNAYGHAAARDDIDATLHLGDYLYEYKRGGYDLPQFAGRIFPDAETLTLADYRLRYASYRADPQLRAVHRMHPMIASPDDHETTNDSWEGGAQNHQPDEGDWGSRKHAAMQVYREWMPVGEEPWKVYPIGDLATYYRTDTRTIARSEPREWRDILTPGQDPAKALTAFRDGPWQDAGATMLGTEQESWLYHRWTRDRATWTVLGVGTNMGYAAPPPQAAEWLGPDAPERAKAYLRTGILAGRAGLPYNLDNWGGYPAARRRLLGAAQRTGRDLIVLTGDSHNAWGFDLKNDGRAAGVEFGGHSVTSPGFENSLRGVDPKRVATEMIAANPAELRYMDTSNRGYLDVELTSAAATTTYNFMATTNEVSLATKQPDRLTVRRGRRVLERA